MHINKLTNKHICIWVQFKSSILLCPIIFQIGTITMNKDPHGKPQLLASQPGGTYVTLILKQDAPPDESAPSEARYVQRNSHLYHGSYQWIPKMFYLNKNCIDSYIIIGFLKYRYRGNIHISGSPSR